MSRALRIGLVGLLLWTGCRTPIPTAQPLPTTDPRPAALLARLERHADSVRGIRGSARVAIEGQRGASFAKHLVLLERPARLRVEVLGLLDQRVAVLATDGDRYQLYRAELGAIEEGSVYREVLEEVAGLPLTPEEAVALLLGGPALAAPVSAALVGGDTLQVELAEAPDRGRRLVEFDAAGNLRRYRRADASGDAQIDVRYDDFAPIAGIPFAHTVRLAFPASQVQAEVRFRRVELNPTLDPRVFRLQTSGPG